MSASELPQAVSNAADGDELAQHIQASRRAYMEAAAPLLVELANAGFSTSTVGDLARSSVRYRLAIPILLRWLPQVAYEPLKSDILNALSVRWARPLVARPLIDEFLRVDDPGGSGIRWAIADAIERVADDSVLDDIIAIVTDTKYGKAREMLALALARMKSPRALPVLRELLKDEQVVGHAAMAVGKLRDTESLAELGHLTHHPKSWVRREAKKSINRIEASNG